MDQSEVRNYGDTMGIVDKLIRSGFTVISPNKRAVEPINSLSVNTQKLSEQSEIKQGRHSSVRA